MPNAFPLLLCNGVPCAVVGSKEQFEHAIEAFIACEPVTEQGQPHLSDMHACQKLNFPSLDLCREYGTPGYEQAKLIHFSHATRHGKLRSELIEEWLAGKEPVMRQWEGPIPAEAFTGPMQILPHGKHTCFRGQTADEIVAGLEQAPDPPTTRASKVRFHINALAELSDTPSRKILTVKELRKQGLIGKPKKRKRRKWKL